MWSFMDMLMPDISGLDVLLEMKNIDPTVKVIMVSGFCNEELIQQSQDAGVVKFIRKPYSIDDLIQTVYGIVELS